MQIFNRNKENNGGLLSRIGSPLAKKREREAENGKSRSPIGKGEVREAAATLRRYKEGKANLEQRIIDNEQWYKLRHWECMRAEEDEVKPASAWLFNAIANKHADAMDNFPSVNVLPREEGDKGEAEMLTSIMPVVLDGCDFEETYSEVTNYKLKMGTGAYGVFWDKSKLGGLGDVAIPKIDLLNLFWEPGISNIQYSRNVFHIELCDNDTLEARYPTLRGKLGSRTASLDVAEYVYDDKVDTTGKSVVVDWYYKKAIGSRTLLHYVKFVGDEVLYASENDPAYANRGWYDHGLYPFVLDPLFPTAGTPTGFGFIDVGKSPQEFIDRGNQAIMKNMLANAAPRYFISNNSGINEDEFADLSCEFVHAEGSLGQDSVRPIEGKPLGEIYVAVINNKIEELKETTGNRDVSTGGTTGGVTAAAGLAAMQEAGSKLSRDMNKASYRAFRKVCYMVIELIRQFYDRTRSFRILGEDGTARFIQYSNSKIKAQSQGVEYNTDMGYRLPLFDLEITAQKQSPYSKMAQNELALQFFGRGFFNPELSDQALACLDMMDFDRKQFVIKKIAQNGTMYEQLIHTQQQMLMLAQIVDAERGSNLAEQIAAGISGGTPVAAVDGRSAAKKVENTEALGGEARESSTTKKARERVAESTDPN